MNSLAQIIKRSILLAAFVATLNLTPANAQEESPPARAAAVESSDDDIVERLKRATQELLDAIAPGDKGVWQRLLAEGSIVGVVRPESRHQLSHDEHLGQAGRRAVAARRNAGHGNPERAETGSRRIDRRENYDLVWRKLK